MENNCQVCHLWTLSLKKICSISYSSNMTLLLWSKFMQMELWKVKNRDLPFLLPCVEGPSLSGTSSTEEFCTAKPQNPTILHRGTQTEVKSHPTTISWHVFSANSSFFLLPGFFFMCPSQIEASLFNFCYLYPVIYKGQHKLSYITRVYNLELNHPLIVCAHQCFSSESDKQQGPKVC